MDNRLDFISNIKPEYIEQMTSIRQDFISLDKRLQTMAQCTKDAATLRTIALSRTNIEIACQYAIKSLCLMGEIK